MTTAAMKLSGFRVTNFRSVEDSGWIETDEIASLIGTNESGKTNLLVPLWKLKPAKDGGIKLLTDAPRKSYNKIREQVDKPRFITARFEITKASVAQEVAAKVGLSPDRVKVVEVSRDFSGKYHIHFPDGQPIKSLALEPIVEAIQSASDEIGRLEPSGKGDESLKESVQGNVTKALKHAQSVGSEATRQTIKELKALLPAAATENAPARSTIAPRYGQLLDLLDAKLAELSKTNPDSVEGVAEVVVKHMPAFVYYSTYGNLDSEIYLPHVIANLERKDISGREEARARTLRVLFDFVRLKPNEILELGKDVNPSENPTDDVVKAFAEKKKERSVLMQSAGTELTKSFRDWWKQGEYRIRFEADGNHFRIWISDDQRPEEIELEGRSTGLQ